MSTDFTTQYTPVTDALGSSFTDLGGVGQQPANLMQGLAMNGITPSPGPSPQLQDKGFDAVLKAPPAPSVTAPKIDPPVIRTPSVVPHKPGG